MTLMIAAKDSEFDARLLVGIRVALEKARDLGYRVERMDVKASLNNDICSVYFTPIADPGTISTGGDLSVIVDAQKEQVRQVTRGQ